ncbi:uncharacterized protein LOC129762148 [Toxorhynchites rutilus septentrionalis]|uniref:uncharacterized protein LOC129762148 n=1 Tax=Toxorhynchites rutilus septentrionalis TaxID=329112 RepID=UPI00247AC14F|nr:uncharacterized protein LOC129762148 [Toxorhynchites rutilus septentrionalis]XP_055616118.1 uncharacterized protein LOC129762148 [Toxorhynchites rutilus septentrionalis]
MHLSKTAYLTVLLCLAATVTSVLSQDNSRNNLLLRRGNIGRQNPLAKTTTTTPPPEYADDEYVDEEGEHVEGEEGDEPAGHQPVTTTTTTTEKPKNIRPSIRPFRSNDDLLSALKKRRMESKNQKPAPPKEKVYDDEDIPAAAPAKAAKSPSIVPKGRRFGSARKEPEQNASPSEQSEQTNNGNDNSSGKSLTSRLGRSRFALKQ